MVSCSCLRNWLYHSSRQKRRYREDSYLIWFSKDYTHNYNKISHRCKYGICSVVDYVNTLVRNLSQPYQVFVSWYASHHIFLVRLQVSQKFSFDVDKIFIASFTGRDCLQMKTNCHNLFGFRKLSKLWRAGPHVREGPQLLTNHRLLLWNP